MTYSSCNDTPMTGQAMDELMVIGAVLALLVVGGALMGWLSMLRIRELEQRLRQVEARLLHPASTVIPSRRVLPDVDKSAVSVAVATEATRVMPGEASRMDGDEWTTSKDAADATHLAQGSSLFGTLLKRLLYGASTADVSSKQASERAVRLGPEYGHASRFITLVREHWMILVGALSLVMAGVLLVGYSLDQGLLGPGVRLALGLGFGVIMGLLAEWLRLRTTQSSSLTGAISGAGSLVVAASLLAGHYLLSLISLPTTLFTLALLSLWTMERARHHGPWLAALGMLGGYALPLALPVARLLDGSANLLLLCHIGVIALACRLLYQQVAMNWLYWGGLLGAVGWWLMLNPAELSILEGRMLGSIWLGAIALAYLSPWRGVLPIQANSTNQQEEAVISDEAWYPWQANVSLRRQWLAGTLLGATIALSLWCQSIESSGVVGELSNGMSWGMIGILPMLVIAWSSRRHAVLWSMLLVNVTLWLLVWATTLSQESGTEIIGWPLLISLTLLILARWQPESIARTEHLRLVGACWWALATLTPLFAWMLAIWQGVMPGNTASGTGEILLNGALPPLIWGLACWIGANRFYAREGVQLAAGLWLPAQFGIFLSLVIGLEGPSLTLALALQLLGLTACEWRWWRNSQSTARSLFSELTRLLAWGLVLRLTYEAATGRYVDLPHWPLQVFLPVLACVALASAGMRHRPRIQRWLEGVVVQLAVATPVLEIRYLLTGGEPFTGSLSLPEASLQILALAGVAAGYTWRAKGARSDVSLYRWLAMGVGSLTIIAWCSAVLLAFNPLWYPDSMGAWPILNWLLPAYGIPALGAAFAWHLLSQGSRLRRLCEGFGLLSGGLWVGLNLRHHWHGEELGLWHGVVQAELYTYSLALLCIAAALVVSGAKLQQQHWQRVGQGVLILAVIKVGAWDTETLEGLWRAGSWLGLGTALMLLAGLFRRLAGAGSGDK